jgi:predicted acylesterase/phospholipase RssA
MGVAFTSALLIVLLGLQACSSIQRVPVPQSAALSARPLAGEPVRVWGDEPPQHAAIMAERRLAQARAAGVSQNATPTLLAISGGASDGAFGAGLLNGWSAAGTRPRFDVVTGVSTGAIIAPFAFLGPAHDDQLKSIYTEYGKSDIFKVRNIFSMAANASVVDTGPLEGLIAQYVTPELVSAIAAEHRKGRRLLIGTTHLDAQRPVIWSVGDIAQRGDDEAVNLIRKLILASAAVPGVFPPVLIQVEYDGKVYDEMHVDGGVTNQLFIFPARLRPGIKARHPSGVAARLFVIRNGRLNPEWESTEPGLVKIAGRSIMSLLKYQGMGDINRLYLQALENKVEFNLASIPETFAAKEKELFDLDYMRGLYEAGFQLGRAGYKWQKAPPHFSPGQPVPRNTAVAYSG